MKKFFTTCALAFLLGVAGANADITVKFVVTGVSDAYTHVTYGTSSPDDVTSTLDSDTYTMTLTTSPGYFFIKPAEGYSISNISSSVNTIVSNTESGQGTTGTWTDYTSIMGCYGFNIYAEEANNDATITITLASGSGTTPTPSEQTPYEVEATYTLPEGVSAWSDLVASASINTNPVTESNGKLSIDFGQQGGASVNTNGTLMINFVNTDGKLAYDVESVTAVSTYTIDQATEGYETTQVVTPNPYPVNGTSASIGLDAVRNFPKTGSTSDSETAAYTLTGLALTFNLASQEESEYDVVVTFNLTLMNIQGKQASEVVSVTVNDDELEFTGNSFTVGYNTSGASNEEGEDVTEAPTVVITTDEGYVVHTFSFADELSGLVYSPTDNVLFALLNLADDNNGLAIDVVIAPEAETSVPVIFNLGDAEDLIESVRFDGKTYGAAGGALLDLEIGLPVVTSNVFTINFAKTTDNDPLYLVSDVAVTIQTAQGNSELSASITDDGLTASFEVPADAETITIAITAKENPAAGVATLNAVSGDAVIYNLQGQKVANPSNGIFIVNGKKVVIR